MKVRGHYIDGSIGRVLMESRRGAKVYPEGAVHSAAAERAYLDTRRVDASHSLCADARGDPMTGYRPVQVLVELLKTLHDRRPDHQRMPRIGLEVSGWGCRRY
jgi:hypothetical protein